MNDKPAKSSNVGGVLLGIGAGLAAGALAGWFIKWGVDRYHRLQMEKLQGGSEGLDMTTVVGESPYLLQESLEALEKGGEALGTLAGRTANLTRQFQQTVDELENKVFNYEDTGESGYRLPNIEEDYLYRSHPPSEEGGADEDASDEDLEEEAS